MTIRWLLTLVLSPLLAGSPALGQARTEPAPVVLEHQKGFSKGAYSAFSYAFAAAGTQLAVKRDYDAVWTIDPSSFPAASVLDWYVPAGTIPNKKGVWGIYHISFGNYSASRHQTPVIPRKVADLTEFRTEFDWTHSGSTNFNLLHEFFVTRTPRPQPQTVYMTEGYLEIGVFLHMPAITRTYHEKGVRIGPDHVNEGVTYSVRRNQDYVTFAPTDYRERLSGTIDWKSALQYLVAQGVLSGDEYVNGAGFGVEPTVGGGKGQTTVRRLDITLK